MNSVRSVQNLLPAGKQAGRGAMPCGGFVDDGRAKKMRQDDDAEFVGASFIGGILCRRKKKCSEASRTAICR